MASFLITFKPASENPKRGWPLSELQNLVRRLERTCRRILEIHQSQRCTSRRPHFLASPRKRRPCDYRIRQNQWRPSKDIWNASNSGLVRGAKLEEEVWKEFSGNPHHCHEVAQAIIASLECPDNEFDANDDNEIQEAPEGRLLTRIHLSRERNRRLVEAKRKKAMASNGRLACEVCEFDFSIAYGDRASGFIECHHTKPLAILGIEAKTHIDDLALVAPTAIE